MTERLSITRMITAATAAAGAIAIALATSDSSAQERAGAAAGSPDPRVTFAVFGREQRPGDVLPAAVADQLTSIAEDEGVDLDGARAVAPAGRGYVYAIPGRDKVCLAIPDPIDGYGVTCQDAEGALDGRSWVGLTGLPGQREGDVRMAILAPDGVETVTAVSTAGETRTLPVADNVAFADLADSASVGYTDGDGDHSVDVPGTPAQFVVEE